MALIFLILTVDYCDCSPQAEQSEYEDDNFEINKGEFCLSKLAGTQEVYHYVVEVIGVKSGRLDVKYLKTYLNQ